MRKKNYKGRCEKVSVSKSEDVCRLYSEIQKKYLDMLEENQEIKEIQCNVLLDGLEIGEYTSDFVCKKTGNHLMVRECVEEKYLMKQALKLQQEQNKQERKERSRKKKEVEEQRMFELKQRKKREKHKGH